VSLLYIVVIRDKPRDGGEPETKNGSLTLLR